MQAVPGLPFELARVGLISVAGTFPHIAANTLESNRTYWQTVCTLIRVVSPGSTWVYAMATVSPGTTENVETVLEAVTVVLMVVLLTERDNAVGAPFLYSVTT